MENLYAKREICALLKQICREVDRCQPAALTSAWHVYGTIADEISGVHGRVVDLAGEILSEARLAMVQVQQIADPLITLDGDTATSETKVMLVRRLGSDHSGQSVDRHVHGIYRDRWSRRAGRWGIDHRDVIAILSWEQTVRPSATGLRARRDPSDPGSMLLADFGFGRCEGRGEVRKVCIDTVLAEREIFLQLNNYCRGLDRFDVDLWRSVWHRDATLDYESGDIRGKAMDRAIQMTWGHAAFAGHSHQISNATILVDGDKAVSETYANAILRSYPDNAGNQIDFHYRGRYLDNWSRRDGRWAIDHRQLVEEFMWQEPAIPARMMRAVRRDREDPSYKLFASLDPCDEHSLETHMSEQEIRRQVAQYFDAIDRPDENLWQSLWHSGATLEIESDGIQGVAADAFAGLLVNSMGRSHAGTNSIIVVNDDRAVSETGFTAMNFYMADGSLVRENRRGRLLDRWSKREGRWAIDHRRQIEDLA